MNWTVNCLSVSWGLHWRKKKKCHGSPLGGRRVYKKRLNWNKPTVCHSRLSVVIVAFIPVRCNVIVDCFMLWQKKTEVCFCGALKKLWECLCYTYWNKQISNWNMRKFSGSDLNMCIIFRQSHSSDILLSFLKHYPYGGLQPGHSYFCLINNSHIDVLKMHFYALL